MLYALYTAGFFLAGVLPHGFCYFLAEMSARIYFFTCGDDKTKLKSNIRQVLGKDVSEAVLDRHVRRIYINFAKYLVDFFKFRGVTKEYIKKNFTIHNVEALDKCRQKGNGAILLTAHLGNWELGGAVVAGLGYPVSAIVWEHPDEKINNLFSSRRADNNLKCIPLGMQIKNCFKVLKRNEILAIAGDKNYTAGGLEVEFFGKKAVMPQGAAAFSIKTGAPIVIGFLIRDKNDSFILSFADPIEYPVTGDHDGDIQGLMKCCMVIFEKYIEKYPDQWYVFDYIWKPEKTIQ
ncbi:MAG TPA: lysophospholipid acyltransferase family protein [Candidatus Omnitrophota bacterium]|nr:lysophospholipid acyltransferase family protein [Candidatus Omnitrophota bacterium]HPS20269.1 lysophospholipid acyltransferase family protein [Candidatus Omnitrophota bacterium]